MDDVKAWFAKLLLKIKILAIIYCILLAVCLVYAIIIYFTNKGVELSSQTLTTNGVYLLKSSYFQIFENAIFGNIQSVLSATRKAIVFNDTFRALTILVAVLAVVLMGFTMLIGDQKITIKEFFMDILLIFGSASILLYYDPALSVNPNATSQPEKYITLLYNFLQSISDFISKMLFASVGDFMNIQYKDGTTVGYYAPIDVIASLFFDDTIAYRFKMKLAALILSPMVILVPLLLIILLYYLVPCVLSVFVAILFAKATIMFSVQFLPFFILFSSINDVKIKINKKAKGMNLSMKLIIEGIAQPMLFLALTSFLAGFLFYIFVISNINDIFNFSITNGKGIQENYEKCPVYQICKKKCDIRIYTAQSRLCNWLEPDCVIAKRLADKEEIFNGTQVGYDITNATTLSDATNCLNTNNWTNYDCVNAPQMCYDYKCPIRVFNFLGASIGVFDGTQIGYNPVNITTMTDFFDCLTKPDKWTKTCVDIPDNVECAARNLVRQAFYSQTKSSLPPMTSPVDFPYSTFLFGLIKLWIGIEMYKKLFGKISPIIENLTSGSGAGGSAASGIFTSGGGIYNKDNDVGKAMGSYQEGVDSAIKTGFGYDVNDKMFNDPLEKNDDGSYKSLFNTDESKSDMSKSLVAAPVMAAVQAYNDNVKKVNDAKQAIVDAGKKALDGVNAVGKKVVGGAVDGALKVGGEALKNGSAAIGTAATSGVVAATTAATTALTAAGTAATGGVGAVLIPVAIAANTAIAGSAVAIGTAATTAASVGGEAMTQAGNLHLGSAGVNAVGDAVTNTAKGAIDSATPKDLNTVTVNADMSITETATSMSAPKLGQ